MWAVVKDQSGKNVEGGPTSPKIKERFRVLYPKSISNQTF